MSAKATSDNESLASGELSVIDQTQESAPSLLETVATSSTGAPPAKRGRKAGDVWTYFTNAILPCQLASAVCMHCLSTVFYYKKGENVARHLNNCKEFRQLMAGMDEDGRPVWYKPNKHQKLSGPPGSISIQTSMASHAVPSLTKEQLKAFQKDMALHYFVSGTSFQRIEEANLAKALARLRPGLILPSRKQLAGPLLDECYLDVKNRVTSIMNNAVSCIISDGWSNIAMESVINYMAVSPERSLFLECILTGQQTHTADFIANDIARVIRSYPDTTFAGAVTDNTSANKKAWSLLNGMFPSRFFQGCTSHTLNLLVKDIFGATKTKRAGQSEVQFQDGYPFEYLLTFVDVCKDIVRFFQNHHVEKAALKEMQLPGKERMLAAPAPTRWGSLQAMCFTLQHAEKHLHRIVSERNFVHGTAAQKAERQKILSAITDADFINKLKKVQEILRPIDILTVKYQSDKVAISEVISDFKDMVTYYGAICSEGKISQAEQAFLMMKVTSRYDFVSGKAHGYAHVLDPRFVGARQVVEDELILTPLKDDQDEISDAQKEQLFVELTNYSIRAKKEKDEKSLNYRMME
jgi:Protein of unknown function (DUF 659)